jgi:hypothetical protein
MAFLITPLVLSEEISDFENIPFLPETLDVARDSYREKVVMAPYSPFIQDLIEKIYGEKKRIYLMAIAERCHGQ